MNILPRFCGIAMIFALRVTAYAEGEPAAPHIANAEDAAMVASGKTVYMQYCASCHGKRLQGQPLWQIEDQYSARRAPAHDESGHTWQHSDAEIFQKTKFGRFSSDPPGDRSYMPAFKETLSDPQILQVMAFIKARWPLGLRVSQAMLNPGFAGMPPHADQVDWTLPPNCRASALRWRTESR